jgi:hypothetical protein
MRSMTAFVLIAVIALGVAVPAAAYQVESGHPRLYVTSSDVAALRAKVQGPQRAASVRPATSRMVSMRESNN